MVEVAAKAGRPTDNPKSKPIHVRLDKNSEDTLSKYCEQENVTQAEAIRRGIKKLEADIREE